MAMLLLLSAIMAIPSANMPVIDPNGAQSADCPATSRYEAARRGKGPQARKLGDLPDADLYKAVYRRIGRCEAPIVVKFGVSGR
jgi:hypothetical protein